MSVLIHDNYVSDFRTVCTSDGEVLFFQTCGKCIVVQQLSLVTQPLSGSKRTVLSHYCLLRQSLIGESSAIDSASGRI